MTGSAPTVVAKIKVSPTSPPRAPPAAGGGFVWVSEYGRPYLLSIDPKTNKVLAPHADRHRLVRARLRRRVALDRGHELEHDQPRLRATGKRLKTIPVGTQPYDATFAFGSAWTTPHGDGQLERIDPARTASSKRWPAPQRDRRRRRVRLGVGDRCRTASSASTRPRARSSRRSRSTAVPRWTAASNDAVWVDTATALVRIDPQTNAVTATVTLPSRTRRPGRGRRQVWVPMIRAELGRDHRPGLERGRGDREGRGRPVRRHRDRAARHGCRAGRAATSGGSGRDKKKGPPRKAARLPVTSWDFVEALPADTGGALRESPTLARRFPVRSRGHASTSWYLHCPYLKSPTPDHLLSADTIPLADRSGRTPLRSTSSRTQQRGEVVVDDAARLHRGVDRRRPDETEARRLQRFESARRLRRRRAPVGVRPRRRARARRVRPEELVRAGYRPRAARPSPARSRSPPRSCRGDGRSTASPSSRSTSRLAEAATRSGSKPAKAARKPRACAGSSATRAPTGSPRGTAARRGPARPGPAGPTPRRGRRGRAGRSSPSSGSTGCTSATSTLTIPSSTRRGTCRPARRRAALSGRPVAQVERGAVARTDDAARVLLPVALAERAVVVRAAILERVELAAAVVDADRRPADA